MKQWLLRISIFVVALLFCGCTQKGDTENLEFVAIDELISHPEKYDGKSVCTEAIYASGFETNVIGASTYQKGSAVYITEPAIWVEGAEIIARDDCFKTDTAPPAEFCNIRICGLFEYGENFGHLGQYKYQLRADNK